MKYFTDDVSQFCITTVKICIFGSWLSTLPSNPSILGFSLKFPRDVQISRITDLLSLNILSDLSMPHQVGEATHL